MTHFCVSWQTEISIRIFLEVVGSRIFLFSASSCFYRWRRKYRLQGNTACSVIHESTEELTAPLTHTQTPTRTHSHTNTHTYTQTHKHTKSSTKRVHTCTLSQSHAYSHSRTHALAHSFSTSDLRFTDAVRLSFYWKWPKFLCWAFNKSAGFPSLQSLQK